MQLYFTFGYIYIKDMHFIFFTSTIVMIKNSRWLIGHNSLIYLFIYNIKIENR